VTRAFAAGPSISVNPATANWTVGQTYSVQFVVDGSGQEFDVASADVGFSSNLSVQGVVLGDCNFAFVKTPSTQNLSFAGAILGGSSNHCTAFTAQIKPVNSGIGAVTLSNGSIISHTSPSHEIISSVQNGRFALNNEGVTAQVISPVPPVLVSPTRVPARTTQPTPQTVAARQSQIASIVEPAATSYKLDITVFDPLLNPAINRLVELVNLDKKQTTNKAGQVEFRGVVGGVHTIQVKDKNKNLAEQIVNLSGPQQVYALSIIESQNKLPQPTQSGTGNSLLKIILIAVGVIVALNVIGFSIYFMRKRRSSVE
jgi:hypothetical protein